MKPTVWGDLGLYAKNAARNLKLGAVTTIEQSADGVVLSIDQKFKGVM